MIVLDRLASLARAGDRLVSFLAMILILLMLVSGCYSLYDNWLVGQGGFSQDLMQYKPRSGQTVSLTELVKKNPDVIGWIEIDDTHIDQPVTQGNDDMEYVNKDALGNFSLSGSIFLSCQNSSDFSDPYLLTYGHHMENGGMYGDVTEFLDKDYFNTHKTGTLYDLDASWDIRLFAALETDASDSRVFSVTGYRESGITDLNEYLKNNSRQYRDIGIKDGDQILALSTCYDATTNARVILFGRLENRQSGGEKADDEKTIYDPDAGSDDSADAAAAASEGTGNRL